MSNDCATPNVVVVIVTATGGGRFWRSWQPRSLPAGQPASQRASKVHSAGDKVVAVFLPSTSARRRLVALANSQAGWPTNKLIVVILFLPSSPERDANEITIGCVVAQLDRQVDKFSRRQRDRPERDRP